MRLAKAKFEKVGPFKDFSIEFKKNKKKNLAEVHILTGPNGSGKSTIIKTLAYFFGNSTSRNMEAVEIGGLFWTSGEKGSFVEAAGDLSKSPSVITTSGYDMGFGGVVTSHDDSFDPFHLYQKKSGHYRSSDKETRFDYVVFGYSGKRALRYPHFGSPYQDMSVSESSASGSTSGYGNGNAGWNPLVSAIDFEGRIPRELSVEEWVEDTFSRAAIAGQKGDKERQRITLSTLRKFEEILCEITERTIKFSVDVEVYKRTVVELDGTEVEFGVLPDGLKSILSWIGDLLMRMDSIRWEKKQSVFDQPIILFLDEIDIHLHPSWQMKILPIIQKTFVNAQIFVSTHSPFVVASVEDAYVYDLNIDKDGFSYLEQAPILTERGQSYIRVLQEVFDIEGEFVDSWSRNNLKAFNLLLEKTKSKNSKAYKDAQTIGAKLASENVELRDIVSISLKQLERRVSKPIA